MKTAENAPIGLVAKAKKFFFGTQNRKIITSIVLFVGIAAALGFAIWNIRPLLVDDVVMEEFPTVMMPASGTSMPADGQMPVMAEPGLLSTGQFIGSDGFHRGAGTANIFELADGSRVLRFEQDFNVTNGPRLVVWLSDLTRLNGATGNSVGSSPENYISLGSLTGNIGSQNYTIPADVDLDDYSSVIIWCEPFRVAFAIAPLETS